MVAGIVSVEGDASTTLDCGGGITFGERGTASGSEFKFVRKGMVCGAFADGFVG